MSATPAVKFAIIGDAFVDISVGPLDALPAPGGDVEVSMVSQGPGGSALNTAWHLAAQDVPTTLHAAVGRDRMAQVLSNALQTESKVLDAGKTLSVLEHETTATCVSMFGPYVDRTFMSTYGAAKTATVAQLLGRGGADALGDDVTHVHIGGFYVCKGIHAGLPEAVKRLRARGVKVSMDPNFDAAGQWTPPAMLSVIRGPSAVDVLMPSEVEACEITGKDTADEALEVLLGGGEDGGGGVGLVVIKRGAMGVLAGDAFGERWRVPACTVSRVLDTNGAGDAFNAGFLRVWAQGKGVEAALHVGCASAALAVQHAGAVGPWAPDRATVDAQTEAEYGDKPWWQKGILACMAPRRLA